MIPYFSQSVIPIHQDRIGSGRPASRLEVQQHLLEHKHRGYRDLSGAVHQPSLIPLRRGFVSVRHSFGSVLISLGSWMARRTAARPEVLARR